MSDKSQPACPNCGSTDVYRQRFLSRFQNLIVCQCRKCLAGWYE